MSLMKVDIRTLQRHKTIGLPEKGCRLEKSVYMFTQITTKGTTPALADGARENTEVRFVKGKTGQIKSR
jgi:hypothetical protein